MKLLLPEIGDIIRVSWGDLVVTDVKSDCIKMGSFSDQKNKFARFLESGHYLSLIKK